MVPAGLGPVASKGVIVGRISRDFSIVQARSSGDGGRRIVAAGHCVRGPEPHRPTGAGGISGTVTIDGSSTVAPLSEAAADLFRDIEPGVNVTVATTGTGGGFKKFCAGETDISDASRAIKDDEIAACKAAGIEYTEVVIANDGLSVVVNPENDWAVPHGRRSTQHHVGAGVGGQDHELEPDRPVVPGRAADPVWCRHRLGHVRLLHRRDQR